MLLNGYHTVANLIYWCRYKYLWLHPIPPPKKNPCWRNKSLAAVLGSSQPISNKLFKFVSRGREVYSCFVRVSTLVFPDVEVMGFRVPALFWLTLRLNNQSDSMSLPVRPWFGTVSCTLKCGVRILTPCFGEGDVTLYAVLPRCVVGALWFAQYSTLYSLSK